MSCRPVSGFCLKCRERRTHRNQDPALIAVLLSAKISTVVDGVEIVELFFSVKISLYVKVW